MSLYLKRYAFDEVLINSAPEKELGIIICIPSYKEEHLDKTLYNLSKAKLPEQQVEVIILINYPEHDNEVADFSKKQYESLSKKAEDLNNPRVKFHFLLKALPKKHAGVGLARKIIMDEAVRRFESIKNVQGIIVAYDADCVVRHNYLPSIEKFFKTNPKANGCSIYFEHTPDATYGEKNYKAVYEYELHLRCYIDALRWCGIPHAFQTIGSSMAVRHKAYQKQGGMNKRKAGEDFYFLHRIIPLGEFGDLTNTTVYPSIRASERVPFGTGKAIIKWFENNTQQSYHPDSYPPLKEFVLSVTRFYKEDLNSIAKVTSGFSKPLQSFLLEKGFKEEIARIKMNSKNENQFRKQFFQWFDGFLVMKYLHHVRDNYLPMVDVIDSAREISKWLTSEESQNLLEWYREYDKKNPSYLKSL